MMPASLRGGRRLQMDGQFGNGQQYGGNMANQAGQQYGGNMANQAGQQYGGQEFNNYNGQQFNNGQQYGGWANRAMGYGNQLGDVTSFGSVLDFVPKWTK